MTFYIESRNTDPTYNLALEQVLFDRMGREDKCFMLWQNHNSIIIGKHQNTLEEIDAAFVKEQEITVARRLSGGGAVYHDMGNLNFTFITPLENKQGLDFGFFCEPVQKALVSFGVPVEISGRNDMTVEGKKFSGNAQYIKNNKIMHHGTILYDSNLEMVGKALKAKDKVESKAIKSTQSRVTNIRPYMKNDMSTNDFWAALKNFLLPVFGMNEIAVDAKDHRAALELREKVYSQWNWNYGNSPPHTLRKTRRFENCGKIDIFLDVERQGVIKNISFYGDYFASRDSCELEKLLTGHHLEYNEIQALLADTEISQFFYGLDTDRFMALLFE
ncbi:MAG: lipoate--protein ligase [Treponema sp.]|jgi:lipoate-protein ligase A|nr:lipoate--protein ligase [Treponema sp.]